MHCGAAIKQTAVIKCSTITRAAVPMMSLRRHFDISPTSLRRHPDITPTSLRRHSNVTLHVPQRHSNVTPQRHLFVEVAFATS